MADSKISIIVNGQPAAVRGARSPVEDFLVSQSLRVVDLGVEALKTEVENTLSSILDMLDSIDLKQHTFDIGSVSFTLSINASGKLSLLSAVSGSVGSQTGLTFNLVYKGAPPVGSDNPTP